MKQRNQDWYQGEPRDERFRLPETPVHAPETAQAPADINNACGDFPRLRSCSNIEELSLPEHSQTEVTAKISSQKGSEATSLQDDSYRTAAHSQPAVRNQFFFVEYVTTALKSSAVWSGAGAAVFCLESSLFAVAGHLAVGAKTLVNEVRLKRNSTRAPGAEQSTVRENANALVGQPGYRGLLSDTLNSPAFNTLATGAFYLTASTQCLFRGQLFESSVFSTYFFGLMAMSHAMAAGYSGTRTTQTLPERAFRSVWSQLPERLQGFLKNPSVWLAAGNLPLVGVACNLQDIAANPLVTLPAAVGLLLSEFGLVTALNTLVRGPGTSDKASAAMKADPEIARKSEATSFAQGLLLNSAGHLLVGTSSLMQGALYIGMAKMLWCVACGILGTQIYKASNTPTSSYSAESKS